MFMILLQHELSRLETAEYKSAAFAFINMPISINVPAIRKGRQAEMPSPTIL